MNLMDIYNGFIARGYSAAQAAALTGHVQQESGGNPSNVNQREGAHGLLQWEGPRWTALQNYAQQQGKPWNDPNVQMDFVGQEMGGPEAKSSAAFRGATDVPTASAALYNYIRFGDRSAPNRLANAQRIYSMAAGGDGGNVPAAPVTGGGGDGGGAAPAAMPVSDTGDTSTDGSGGPSGGGIAKGIQGFVGSLAKAQQQSTPQPYQWMQIPTSQAQMAKARLMMQAMAQRDQQQQEPDSGDQQ